MTSPSSASSSDVTTTVSTADGKRTVYGWHAHVYFNADTVDQARQLCEAAAARFPLLLGRVHERQVGPHPDWSCQLAFRHAVFPDLIPWLALNRQGLVVFIHPVTGNDLLDHRDYAIWMGATRPLKLEVLADFEQTISYDF